MQFQAGPLAEATKAIAAGDTAPSFHRHGRNDDRRLDLVAKYRASDFEIQMCHGSASRSWSR